MLGKVPKSTVQGEVAAVSGNQEVRGKLEFWGLRNPGVRKGKPGVKEIEAGSCTDGQKIHCPMESWVFATENGQLVVCSLDYIRVTRQRKAIL